MDWTNDLVMRFLELYQMHPCIWDPKHASHKNRSKVNDAWNAIKNSLEYPGITKELKKKRDTLMAAYRGYKIKIKKSEKSGAGICDVYQPSWYAFALMDSFLASIYTCKESMNTESNQNESLGSEETFDETDTNVSNPEQESTSNVPSQSTVDQGPSTSRQQPMTGSKRRQHDPPELQKAKKQTDEALQILKTVSQFHNSQLIEDDECNIFGKLVAKKLQRLPEDRRDLVMIKINQLIYEESQYQNRQKSSLSSPSNTSHPANTPSPFATSENKNMWTYQYHNYNHSNLGEPHQPRFLFTQEGNFIPEDLIQECNDADVNQPDIIYEGPAAKLNEVIIYAQPPKK